MKEVSHASTVGVLANYKEEDEGCALPGDVFDGVELR